MPTCNSRSSCTSALPPSSPLLAPAPLPRNSRRMPMPEEIVGLLRSKVTLKWPDGHETVYSARELRLRCRCASCVEEMSGAPLLDAAKVPENVRAQRIELVGQYAMQIFWTD